jgi:membrane associated rhomboid family serine protease
MSEPAAPSLEETLRLIASASPPPWYPQLHARETGAARDSLDAPLERLRLGGLVQLTDWERGKGQGYVLTAVGQQALEDRRLLGQIQNGMVPALQAPPPPTTERQGTPGDWERSEAVIDALRNAGPPFVTQALIALNVIVFLAEEGLGQKNNALLERLVLTGHFLVQGEWWRMLTTCFLHGGPLHLVMNMIALFTLGRWVEWLWGPWRFLILYLLAGLGGSCAAMLNNPAQGVVGASGAICGLFGGAAAWLWLNHRFIRRDIAAQWARMLVINTFILVGVSYVPRVSGAAHLGGGIAGVVVALLLNVERFGSRERRWLAVAGLIAVPLVCVGLVVRSMNTNREAWQQPLWNAELLDLHKHAVSQVEVSLTATLKLYEDQVAPLINMNPKRRDAAEVEKVRSALTAQQTRLDDLLQDLERHSSYRVAKMEEARQFGIESVKASIELCRRAEVALQAGANSPADEEAMKDQARDVLQAKRSWGQIFKDRPDD